MHMADALLSPTVGGAMCLVSTGIIAYCSKKVRDEYDDKKVPLMGVLGAFVFAAQMINFTIPVTGSSGHLGGGILLSVLMGPYAAFLTISSVMVVQALFFADGGLLALGCNIFNMGFFPAFVAYPFIFRAITGAAPTQFRMTLAVMISAVACLQLGSFGVVLETVSSGISLLPFPTFTIFMQSIHLAIGFIEGLVTSAILLFVIKARPETVPFAPYLRSAPISSVRTLVISFLVAALLTGGVGVWFASTQPDGLEWAIMKVTGKDELAGSEQGVYGALQYFQRKSAFLPEYNFKKVDDRKESASKPESESEKNESNNSRLGTSLSGVIGGILTLAIICLLGLFLRKKQKTEGCNYK